MTEDQEHIPNNTYLGDGVYASFDGFHIWLAVHDHTNKVVALEPSVVNALLGYALRFGMIKFNVTGGGGGKDD